MKLTIERVSNGYILIDEEGTQVFEETNQELIALQLLLYSICSSLGYYGSKHDAERLFVRIERQNEDV